MMPHSLPDYYARLGVSPSASLAEIKQAYRRLARLYHPDVHGQAHEQTQDERIKQINEAYQILRDNLRRAAYDRLRTDHQRAERIAEEIWRQQEEAAQEPKMTWVEGIKGFMYELRKELRDS